MLIGGLFMPISPATADTVDVTINVSKGTYGITINPAGTFVYVTSADADTVSRINLATNKVDTTIKVGANPRSVAIDPAGTFAYVVNSSDTAKIGTVSKINLATNTVVATIKVGANPRSVAINPAGTFALVTNAGTDKAPGTVSRIKLANAIPLVTTAEPVSFSAIAAYAKLNVPNGATISINVAPSSTPYCKVSGTNVQGVKAGPCKVTVIVKPKTDKSISQTVKLTVTK